jgi:ribokinase
LLTGVKVDSLESAQSAADALHAKGLGTVIITLGSQGSYVSSNAFTGLVPTSKVDAVDTTAAGDTFNGALAVGLVNGKAIEEAVAFANKAATVSVTRIGAQASCPTLEELSVAE